MDNDRLLEHIEDFVAHVNTVSEISEAGLKNTPFPDEVIASLHNHIGNVKHYVSDELTAFNATEQYLSLKAAINELGAMGDDLFQLHHKSAIGDLLYQDLNRRIHELDQLFRKAIDPEYT